MLSMTTTDPSWLQTMLGWLHDPEALLTAMGPWVLWGTMLIVLVESGLLFPFLPGDSLLFTAGLLHTQLGLNLFTLVGLIFVAAFIGAQVGYWLGARFGRRLFTDDARVLKTEHLEKAEQYFAKYGGRSLVIGRFIPLYPHFRSPSRWHGRIPIRAICCLQLLRRPTVGSRHHMRWRSLGWCSFRSRQPLSHHYRDCHRLLAANGC